LTTTKSFKPVVVQVADGDVLGVVAGRNRGRRSKNSVLIDQNDEAARTGNPELDGLIADDVRLFVIVKIRHDHIAAPTVDVRIFPVESAVAATGTDDDAISGAVNQIRSVVAVKVGDSD
jgi:hypothetical protein